MLAAQALLGEDVLLVPEFTLEAAQGDGLQEALAASTSGELLTYLATRPRSSSPSTSGSTASRACARRCATSSRPSCWRARSTAPSRSSRPPAAVPAGRALARARLPGRPGDRRRPPALHRRLLRRLRPRRPAVRPAAGRVDRGDPRRDRQHRDRVPLRPAEQRGASGTAAGHAGGLGRDLALGRPRGRAHRDAGARAQAGGRAEPGRRDGLRALPARDDHGGDAHGISIATALAANNNVFAVREGQMAKVRRSEPRRRRSSSGWFPTITVYNRLEGRPRTRSFDRALKAEVRDALWMLTRQWQVGELEGDDAGSPLRQAPARHSELTTYRPREQPPQPFDDTLPLEARVERRPLPFRARRPTDVARPPTLDGPSVAEAPRERGGLRQQFPHAFPIPRPARRALRRRPRGPARPGRHRRRRRTPDRRRRVYEHRGPPATTRTTARRNRRRHRPEPMSAPDASSRGSSDSSSSRRRRRDAWDAATRVPLRLLDPEATARRSTRPRSTTAATSTGTAFDVDPRAPSLGDAGNPPLRHTDSRRARTLIPTAVDFEGMPNTRWWAFEDRRTNFGDVDADDHGPRQADVPRVRAGVRERLVPRACGPPDRHVADVRGIAVTNVFGERPWIERGRRGAGRRLAALEHLHASRRRRGDGRGHEPAVPADRSRRSRRRRRSRRSARYATRWPTWSGESSRRSRFRAANQARRAKRARDPRVLPTPARPARAAARATGANVRYQVMTAVPEKWIPFIPVHVPGDTRQIQLQRRACPRIIEGGPPQPAKVSPRPPCCAKGSTPGRALLRPRGGGPAGGRQGQRRTARPVARRARAVWLGVDRADRARQGSSGLAFDQLVDVPPET